MIRHILLSLAVALTACVGARADGVPKGLPAVSITTRDGSHVADRQWHAGTKVAISWADGRLSYSCEDAQVKAHGNSSFAKPKKPLTLKFVSPVSVLGMKENRKWFLVSNFMDHSLLRNSLALTAASLTGMAWTSSWRLVNVIENGRYIGVYLVGEEIHVGKDWVDSDPQSGFLVEMDAYPDEGPRFETRYRRLPCNVRYPSSPSEGRFDSIRRAFDDIEEVLYGNGGDDNLLGRLEPLADITTLIDYYIIYELCQNAEPNGPRSVYFYKARDGRLCAGPVWDFDLAFEDMGLDSGGDIRPARFHMSGVRALTTDSLYDSHALWYERLLADSAFRHRLSTRWQELRPRFMTLTDSLDGWRRALEPSALADQAMWGALDPARFDNQPSFESSFLNLRATLIRRIEALDEKFGER